MENYNEALRGQRSRGGLRGEHKEGHKIEKRAEHFECST